jgi:hypothetical protein
MPMAEKEKNYSVIMPNLTVRARIPVTAWKCECELEYYFMQPNRSSVNRDGIFCHLGIERLAKLS